MKLINNWDEKFKVGQEGEDLFLDNGSWVRFAIHIGKLAEIPKKINERQDQHYKGDFTFGNPVGGYDYIEVKTRDPKYSWCCGKDIFIELSNTKEPVKGKEIFDAWLDKYSEKTYLFYQWLEIINDELKIMEPVIVFKPADLKKHKSWLKRYKIRSAENKEYFTNGVVIKLNKLCEKIKVWRITKERVIENDRI